MRGGGERGKRSKGKLGSNYSGEVVRWGGERGHGNVKEKERGGGRERMRGLGWVGGVDGWKGGEGRKWRGRG